MSVAGIDAGGDGNDAAQSLDHFRDLLEAAAQRKFRSRGIFDEDGQPAFDEIKVLRGRRNGRGGLQQSSLAISAAKRAGMQHQIVGAHRERAFDFAAKRLDGFLQEQLIRAGQIHQIIGVDDQRLQIILGRAGEASRSHSG